MVVSGGKRIYIPSNPDDLVTMEKLAALDDTPAHLRPR
jgi:hypothetical protein